MSHWLLKVFAYFVASLVKSIYNSDSCVIHCIVTGNFGVVYKAILQTSGSESVEVAIKSVKSGERDEKEKQNFIREMCTMSKLLHPNIVRLYGLILKGSLELLCMKVS